MTFFNRVLCVNDCETASYALANVRTFDHAVMLLEQGDWETLLLDFDLSNADSTHSGMEILTWLKGRALVAKPNLNILPKNIWLTTGSPDGLDRMQKYMTDFHAYTQDPKHSTCYTLLEVK